MEYGLPLPFYSAHIKLAKFKQHSEMETTFPNEIHRSMLKSKSVSKLKLEIPEPNAVLK